MKPVAQAPRTAWQPFTPKGVAAFARAPLGRLLSVQFMIAVAAASTIVWFVQTAWCPLVTAGIARLPEQGQMRGGQLDWHGAAHEILAENRFLALAVDLEHTGEARSPAQIQVEFGKLDVQVQSLLGFARIAYRRGWTVPCSREELTAWWGAWKPPLLALLGAGVVVFLMLSWSLLASVYSLPVWLGGFFWNRDLSLRASWRLAGAGLMPGALLMSMGIVVYRWGMLEVLGLLIVAAGHLVIGWCYLLPSVLCLERHPGVASFQGNPFTGTVAQADGGTPVAPTVPESNAAPPQT